MIETGCLDMIRGSLSIAFVAVSLSFKGGLAIDEAQLMESPVSARPAEYHILV